MNIPQSYPHSPERYAADIQGADEYIDRNPLPAPQGKRRAYRVIVRQESMHRIIGYRIQAVDINGATRAGQLLAQHLGYSLVSVEPVNAGGGATTGTGTYTGGGTVGSDNGLTSGSET